jgi:hypothetical protein
MIREKINARIRAKKALRKLRECNGECLVTHVGRKSRDACTHECLKVYDREKR